MLSAVIPSRLSYPALRLASQPVDQRSVPGGPLVLSGTPLKNRRLQQIGVQPVSRRSKPSSRTLLIGEQPNPWGLLQSQDRVSRHRGAEHRRRYGRLGGTSLFNTCFNNKNIRLYLHPPQLRRCWRGRRIAGT